PFEDGPQQALCIRQQRADIDLAILRRLTTLEGLKMGRQPRAADGSIVDQPDDSSKLRALGGSQREKIDRAAHDPQNVVELVQDAACELSHDRDPLRAILDWPRLSSHRRSCGAGAARRSLTRGPMAALRLFHRTASAVAPLMQSRCGRLPRKRASRTTFVRSTSAVNAGFCLPVSVYSGTMLHNPATSPGLNAVAGAANSRDGGSIALWPRRGAATGNFPN